MINAQVKAHARRITTLFGTLMILMFAMGCSKATHYASADGTSTGLATGDLGNTGGFPVVTSPTPTPTASGATVVTNPTTGTGSTTAPTVPPYYPPGATPPAQISVTGLTSGQANIPPVVMNHLVLITPSYPGSYIKVTPSVFTVQVAGVTSSGQVIAVQQLVLDPPSVGTVQLSGTTARITIARPGPVNLIAQGTIAGQLFQVSQTLYVPRQIIARWTENEPNTNNDQASKDRNILICANNSPSAQQITIGGPGGPTGALNFAPMQQGVYSPEFVPVADAEVGKHIGAVSITIDGHVPVGAITCNGIVLDCSQAKDSSCLDPLQHHYEQDFAIGNGQL